MNSLPILIIGVPAAAAALAAKLHERQRVEEPEVEVERAEDWTFPPKWREVSRTEVGR